MVEHAKAKLVRKGCDWIVANDVSPETGIMGGDSNTVHLVTPEGVEAWPPQSKDEVAARWSSASPQRWRNEPMNPVEVRLMRLPHGADLPLPAYQSELAAGLDLMAAVPADAPVTIAPGGAPRSRPASPSPCRPAPRGRCGRVPGSRSGTALRC